MSTRQLNHPARVAEQQEHKLQRSVRSLDEETRIWTVTFAADAAKIKTPLPLGYSRLGPNGISWSRGVIMAKQVPLQFLRAAMGP